MEFYDTFMRVRSLAFELFDNDEEKTIDWLLTPNHLFFDLSPLQMIIGKKEESVIKFLEELLGK